MAKLKTIRQLREETGLGVMTIRLALEEAGGDVAKAREILAAKGTAIGAKKAGRPTGQGLIETYGHLGRIGAMIEVSCETDFVARNGQFQAFVHDLVLQVASMNPHSVDELLDQPFFNDQSTTVRQGLSTLMGKIGENVQIKRFARFALGENNP